MEKEMPVDLSDDNDIDVENAPTVDEEIERLYADTLKGFKEGEIVKGHIVKIDQDSVVVDIGFKSEGRILKSEFPNHGRNLKIGDEITVSLERVENKDGQVVLSKEKADKLRVWDDIIKAYRNNEPMEGTVVARIKGGLTIDIGLKAFLPGSQIDLKPIRNLDSLIGQKFRMR